MSEKNTYIKITQDVFQKTVVDEKSSSILVFGADWSGNAEIMNSMMERISGEFSSHLNFFEVDIEKNSEIATFFGITTIPMIIMLKEGEVLNLVKGFTSANNIRKKIKSNYSETRNQSESVS